MLTSEYVLNRMVGCLHLQNPVLMRLICNQYNKKMNTDSDMQNLVHIYICLFPPPMVSSLNVNICVASGHSGRPGLLSLNPSVLFSSVLCSHPDFTGAPCPAFPALTVAAVAQPIPCEEMWKEELWIKRAVPSCLTFNKVPLFTLCIPGCSSLVGGGSWCYCSGQLVVSHCFFHTVKEKPDLICS